jgi:hypothetical protein
MQAIALAIVVAAGACSVESGQDAAETTAVVATEAPPTSVPATPSASSSEPVPTAPPPTLATPAEPKTPPVIRRPFLDPSTCAPVSTQEVASGPFLARPFALGNPEPVPVQAFADPTLGAAGPFAVVLRIPTFRVPQGREPTTINGVPTYVSVYSNGNGEASWALADGTFGYLRARDLDLATIIDVRSRLSPRPPDAAIPGFDVSASTGAGAPALVAEHLTSDLEGGASSLICEVDGRQYRISAVRGEPIAQYLSVIDKPRPLAVAPNGDGVLVITGPAMARGAPTVADVREADAGTWSRLLDPSGN